MYHLRLKGSPYSMGQKTGKTFKECNAQFPIKLNSLQSKHGRQSGDLLKQYLPEAAEEIKGITDAIGIENLLFTSWLMCMGSCLIIRKNHNVEVRGCTAFSFEHNNKVYYGRDNDLPPYLKKVSKSIYYRPKNKYSFILNTSSFINGEEGMNENGLVAAMTFVVPKLDQIVPGLNSLFLVRYILENCKTVKEGIEVLKKLPIASSCNILIADCSNDMVVVECNPLEINIRYPEKNEKGENFVVTVNHFTSEKMKKYDRSRQNVYSSKSRYETSFKALMNSDYDDAITYAMNILQGKYGFMCQYKKIKFETVWSTIFDISNKRMFLSEGNPNIEKYKEDHQLNTNY